MDQELAIDAFAALAHPTRLSVFKLLVQHVPDGVPALTIAERLDAETLAAACPGRITAAAPSRP